MLETGKMNLVRGDKKKTLKSEKHPGNSYCTYRDHLKPTVTNSKRQSK